MPKSPPRPTERAASHAEAEGAGALWLLRDYGECQVSRHLRVPRHENLEVLALATLSASPDHVGTLPGVATGFPVATTGGGPLDLSRSETVTRGAGCGKSARPDLWGAAARRRRAGLLSTRPESWSGQDTSWPGGLTSGAVESYGRRDWPGNGLAGRARG